MNFLYFWMWREPNSLRGYAVNEVIKINNDLSRYSTFSTKMDLGKLIFESL
jgi:hypothetical protein